MNQNSNFKIINNSQSNKNYHNFKVINLNNRKTIDEKKNNKILINNYADETLRKTLNSN